MRAALATVTATKVPPPAVIIQGATLRSGDGPQGVTLRLGKNEELFAEGEAADYFYKVTAGTVKGRPVSLDLPAMETAADIVAGLSEVAAAMANGKITPEEAHAVASVLEGKRRAVGTVALEARIAALEQERSDEAARSTRV